MGFTISSPAFGNDSPIPRQYTCDGADTAPALVWNGAPEGTKSFALIVDDPDAPDPAAPKRTYVHWVVYDIPPSTGEIAEGGALPHGARDGTNDWNRTGYGGPCPPIGRHRYFFKLYALDTAFGDRGPMPKADLERAMRNHVLGSAELVGTYERAGRGSVPKP